MTGIFAPYFQAYVTKIISQYKNFLELNLTTRIPFTGVASENLPSVFTPPVDADALLFGANVDFDSDGVSLRVTDTASGYVWNPQSLTPIGAMAGFSANVLPVLPLTCPFFLSRQSKLQMDFVNAASSPITGGAITWKGIKLLS